MAWPSSSTATFCACHSGWRRAAAGSWSSGTHAQTSMPAAASASAKRSSRPSSKPAATGASGLGKKSDPPSNSSVSSCLNCRSTRRTPSRARRWAVAAASAGTGQFGAARRMIVRGIAVCEVSSGAWGISTAAPGRSVASNGAGGTNEDQGVYFQRCQSPGPSTAKKSTKHSDALTRSAESTADEEGVMGRSGRRGGGETAKSLGLVIGEMAGVKRDLPSLRNHGSRSTARQTKKRKRQKRPPFLAHLDAKFNGAWQGLVSRYRGRDLNSTFFWGCPFFFTFFSCRFAIRLLHGNRSSGNAESPQ